ncbi:uncharacterized protein Cp7Fa isoform X2 [Drosophila bipectinata]|uniref:uncharacterized protein Cp7Fa isoform X2 n=1 Tax=Drosophila bipectinata TaxID=42026 RepID=UPI001C89EF3C|nr:uncharacterized protein LOC108123685 isoform X2 [Drosophila bipectinata]
MMPTSCKLIFCLLLAMYSIQVLMAACVCSEKGSDYCQGCQGPTVIRPKPRYYEPSEVNLSPIGDNCWCSKQLIEPAQLPKTCGKVREIFQYMNAFNNLLGRRWLENAIEFKTQAAQRLAERLQRLEHIDCYKRGTTPCKPTCSCQQSTDSSYAGSSSTGSVYGNIAYAAEKTQDDSPAADPISVSLAAQAGKAINVPEAKLAYGFAQKPVDGEKKVYFSDVPEENLFKLKSEVITLKKRTYVAKQEEEEYAEEEEEEQSSGDEEAAPQLTYKQLGYAAEQFKNPKFKKISSSSSSSSYASKDYKDSGDSYGKVAGKVSVDCGFKPGKITSYRNSKRLETEGSYY